MIGLLAGVFGSGVVRSVKVKRIHFIGFDEFQYFHGARRGRVELVQFFFGEEHVLIFLVLKPFDNLGALDHAVASGAELRLTNARVAHRMELIQADALGSRSGKEPDGNGNQAKSEMALPD